MGRKDAAAATAAAAEDTPTPATPMGSEGGKEAGGQTGKKKKAKNVNKSKRGKRPRVDRTVRWWHQFVSMEAILLYIVAGLALSTLMAHLGYKGRESVVGIDLGTTYSVVAIRRNDGAVEVVPNKHGRRTTPSVVSYQRSGRALVGADAVAVQEKNFRTTIYNAKRFIGKRFAEAGVAQDIADHPFRVLQGPPLGKEGTGDIYFDVKNNPVSPRLVSPEGVGRDIIASLMADVQRHLGHSQVKTVVACVPAKFNTAQRKATERVFSELGLKVARILDEPTAAAVAYGLHRDPNIHHVVVFDIGGGTLDVSLLFLSNGAVEVLRTDGDNHLGGEDFDLKIIEWLEARRAAGELPCLGDEEVHDRAETAKLALSEANAAEVACTARDGARHVVTLTRQDFDRITADLVERAIHPLRTVLAEASLSVADLDEIVMVGGSSRIPRLREQVAAFFGKPLRVSIDPDLAVAVGASRVLD